MRTAALVLFFAALAFGALTEKEYQQAFTDWMQKHEKSYTHDEFFMRYNIWKKNYDFILEENKKDLPYKLAMNHLGDLTDAEFRIYYLGTPIEVHIPLHGEEVEVTPMNVNVPDSVNWIDKGAVTPVKDQGACGSCWAFSTTGAVEGCHQQLSGQLVGLSEQNLLDCSGKYGNMGCQGGLMTQAMDYIIANKGIDTEKAYPYETVTRTCRFKPENVGATLRSYTNVRQGDENDLMAKIATGPTSVAIDASRSSFRFYSSGVYYDSGCSSYSLDHGVLAVGYGTENGQDYYLVKNSWGTTWGDKGYIKMARNRKNNCGIATMATLPICG